MLVRAAQSNAAVWNVLCDHDGVRDPGLIVLLFLHVQHGINGSATRHGLPGSDLDGNSPRISNGQSFDHSDAVVD